MCGLAHPTHPSRHRCCVYLLEWCFHTAAILWQAQTLWSMTGLALQAPAGHGLPAARSGASFDAGTNGFEGNDIVGAPANLDDMGLPPSSNNSPRKGARACSCHAGRECKCTVLHTSGATWMDRQ
jgi:hypothetical protein